MKIINLEALVAALAGAWVIMRLIDALVKPLWEKFGLDKFWLQYVAIAIGGPLAWFTGINALPGFSVVVPVVGRVMTCLVIALGPSFLYDLVDQQPEPPSG